MTDGSAAGGANAQDGHQTLRNDFNPIDTDGLRIFTPSGSLSRVNGTFYRYGGDPRGFRNQYCDISTDLVHWMDKGVILRDTVENNRIEVLIHDATKTYVMFTKHDGNGASLCIATADRPEGRSRFAARR